ncbi:MAG: DUF2799 domain-containing protein [Pseudomonadota bacterium]
MRYLLILLGTIALSACAATTSTLTASQCDANWSDVGFADGAEGAASGKLADYRSACASSGASLSTDDELAWQDGYRDGQDALCETDPSQLTDRELAAQNRLCVTRTAAAGGGNDGYYGHRHYRRPYYGYYGPRIFPFLSIGFGSGGTRVRSGVGIGFGVFNFGFFH